MPLLLVRVRVRMFACAMFTFFTQIVSKPATAFTHDVYDEGASTRYGDEVAKCSKVQYVY